MELLTKNTVSFKHFFVTSTLAEFNFSPTEAFFSG